MGRFRPHRDGSFTTTDVVVSDHTRAVVSDHILRDVRTTTSRPMLSFILVNLLIVFVFAMSLHYYDYIVILLL